MVKALAWGIGLIFVIFVLPMGCMLATGVATVPTEEDRAKRAAAMAYLETFRVVRVCPVAPEAFGQHVLQGSDGRLWLSFYARPSQWRDVVPLGDVQPEQVC